jgi:hypothetical protein
MAKSSKSKHAAKPRKRTKVSLSPRTRRVGGARKSGAGSTTSARLTTLPPRSSVHREWPYVSTSPSNTDSRDGSVQQVVWADTIE